MAEVVGSFPGLLYLQFLITYSTQNRGRRPGEYCNVILSPTVICHHTYLLKSQVMYETNIAFFARDKHQQRATLSI